MHLLGLLVQTVLRVFVRHAGPGTRSAVDRIRNGRRSAKNFAPTPLGMKKELTVFWRCDKNFARLKKKPVSARNTSKVSRDARAAFRGSCASREVFALSANLFFFFPPTDDRQRKKNKIYAHEPLLFFYFLHAAAIQLNNSKKKIIRTVNYTRE